MSRPRLLDLFCCAGGAAYGYMLAGFDVTGIDIKPQPRYPFAFVLGDAFEYVAEHGYEYAAIHASPPCQRYSEATPPANRGNHPDLIAPIRELLQATGKPYVIENVKGAPLSSDAVMLVGSMFGLRTMRPRLFECSFPVPFMLAPMPFAKHAKMGRPPKEGEYVHVVGHMSNVPYCRDAMGIDWMVQGELAEALPPAYTTFIGEHLLSVLRAGEHRSGDSSPERTHDTSAFPGHKIDYRQSTDAPAGNGSCEHSGPVTSEENDGNSHQLILLRDGLD